ncbi:hypothetical protein PsorP6_008670 [Peronosclerospora sorghi]|uniref:Uncharacterized protein n=1 Tax=Peronosclerospora sorghi TaxID=230839 RepID=A0ACC0VZU8_9STRA|nr:hypothetical protein PsorP6_008670 [Peronosclerospora sorghi]
MDTSYVLSIAPRSPKPPYSPAFTSGILALMHQEALEAYDFESHETASRRHFLENAIQRFVAVRMGVYHHLYHQNHSMIGLVVVITRRDIGANYQVHLDNHDLVERTDTSRKARLDSICASYSGQLEGKIGQIIFRVHIFVFFRTSATLLFSISRAGARLGTCQNRVIRSSSVVMALLQLRSMS